MSTGFGTLLKWRKIHPGVDTKKLKTLPVVYRWFDHIVPVVRNFFDFRIPTCSIHRSVWLLMEDIRLIIEILWTCCSAFFHPFGKTLQFLYLIQESRTHFARLKFLNWNLLSFYCVFNAFHAVFRMYVVSYEFLIKMTSIKPYEQLKEDGSLVTWAGSMIRNDMGPFPWTLELTTYLLPVVTRLEAMIFSLFPHVWDDISAFVPHPVRTSQSFHEQLMPLSCDAWFCND